MNVITLGPKGTFSHLATIKAFPNANIFFAEDIEKVFATFQKNDDLEFAILPYMNSYSGIVEETRNRMDKYGVFFAFEISLPIHLYLVGFEPIDKIRILYAHPHSFKQCKQTLKKVLKGFIVKETKSNADSACRLLQEKKPGCGAIVSSFAAKLYQLPILGKNVEDEINNSTRFIVLSKKKRKSSKIFLWTTLTFLLKKKLSTRSYI